MKYVTGLPTRKPKETGYYNKDGKLIEVRPATADELQRTIFEPLRQLKSEKTGTND